MQKLILPEFSDKEAHSDVCLLRFKEHIVTNTLNTMVCDRFPSITFFCHTIINTHAAGKVPLWYVAGCIIGKWPLKRSVIVLSHSLSRTQNLFDFYSPPTIASHDQHKIWSQLLDFIVLRTDLHACLPLPNLNCDSRSPLPNRQVNAPLRHLRGLFRRRPQDRLHQVQVTLGRELAPAGHHVHLRYIGCVALLPGSNRD